MHQVLANPLNDGAVREVDQAITEGYTALNLDSGMLNDGIVPGGLTWAQYIHSKGLLVSAYRLDFSGVSIVAGNGNAKQNPGDNSEVIQSQADFFMTDILDDLLVKNGDRPITHTPQSVTISPFTDRVVIRNNEVFRTLFNITAITPDGTRYALGGIYSPPLGAVELDPLWMLRSTQPAVLAKRSYPVYATPTDRPTYSSDLNALNGLPKSALYKTLTIEVVAQSEPFSTVEPSFIVGKDTVKLNVNGVAFPDPQGRDRAIVGTNCVSPSDPPAEQVAKDLTIAATFNTAPAFTPDPFVFPAQEKPLWQPFNVRFTLDGQVVAEADNRQSDITYSFSTVRDLAPGRHTIGISYDAEDGLDATIRQSSWEGSFQVIICEPPPPSPLPPWRFGPGSLLPPDGFTGTPTFPQAWSDWIGQNIGEPGQPIPVNQAGTLRVHRRYSQQIDPGTADDVDFTTVTTFQLQPGMTIGFVPYNPPTETGFSQRRCGYDGVSAGHTASFYFNITLVVYDAQQREVYRHRLRNGTSESIEYAITTVCGTFTAFSDVRFQHEWWDIVGQ